MKTLKIEGIKIDNVQYLHDMQRQQNNVIRYAYNRFEEGKGRNEIYDLCNNQLNHIDLMDSWFINSAIVKAKEVYDSKCEIEEKNKEYNKKHNPEKLKNKNIKVIFGGQKNFYKRLKGKITKEEFIVKRAMPLQCIGEALQKGNRKLEVFPDRDLIIFYPNQFTEIKIYLPHLKKNYMDQLIYLAQVMNNKSAPVSFELTDSFICLKFDEAILADEAFRKIQSPCNFVYRPYHAIKNRALTFDNNPHEVGISVVEKSDNGNLIILHKEVIDLSKLYSDVEQNKLTKEEYNQHQIDEGNKSRHEIIEVCKYIYKLAEYWHCEKIGAEDLGKMLDNYNSRKINKKNINDWKKRLIFDKLRMMCRSKQNIKFVAVNAAYSSFVGNLIYDYHDSINASIEIARRVISMEESYPLGEGNFYVKKGSSIFPTLDDIKDHWKKYLIDREVFSKGWVASFNLMKTLEVRYRVLADLKQLASFRFRHTSSCITLYKFV